MFNLGKLPNLGKIFANGDLGPVVKGAIGEIQKLPLSSIVSGMTSSMASTLPAQVGSMASGMTNAARPKATAPMPALGQMKQFLDSGAVEKIIYLSILRSAMEKAASSKSFNVETHINDLWIKLSQMRPAAGDIAQLQQAMQQQAEVSELVTEMLTKYSELSKTAIQGIR